MLKSIFTRLRSRRLEQDAYPGRMLTLTYTQHQRRALFLADVALLIVSGLMLSLPGLRDARTSLVDFWSLWVICIGGCVTVFKQAGLYDCILSARPRDQLYFVGAGTLLGSAAPVAVWVLLQGSIHWSAISAVGIAIIFVGGGRLLLHMFWYSGLRFPEVQQKMLCRDTHPHPRVSTPSICRKENVLVKRIFDILIGLGILLFVLPLMVVAGILVLLESGWPVFFVQERVGRYGQPFRLLKFRTLRLNDDDSWVQPGDHRITQVGGLLRRTSIDELPQLFNVIVGDMSLIGPRPEMTAFEQRFAESIPLYVKRRMALPGLTGWAQVSMKRNLVPADVEQVLEYDLFYIEHWSFCFDIAILLKTVTEFAFHRAV
jgi:lipopolysaccharide/colanic/teichoic acid biosynthesis glycosyltransferase